MHNLNPNSIKLLKIKIDLLYLQTHSSMNHENPGMQPSQTLTSLHELQLLGHAE